MINKVATTYCSFLRLQIKREDIIDKCRECDKDRSIHNLRDVCIVSNRLTCIDSKLSEMEILAQPLSLPFIIENLSWLSRQRRYSGGRSTYYNSGALENIFFYNFFDSLGYCIVNVVHVELTILRSNNLIFWFCNYVL
jgi:hypothetical protein